MLLWIALAGHPPSLSASHLISSRRQRPQTEPTMCEHMPTKPLACASAPMPRQDGQSETTSALLFWALLAALWTSGSANSKSSWTGRELMAHPDTALILLRFRLGWRENRYHARTIHPAPKNAEPWLRAQASTQKKRWFRHHRCRDVGVAHQRTDSLALAVL